MTDHSAIYRRMHKDRSRHADQETRASDYQASLIGVVSLIRETSQRYSRGSVTRVAMDNLLLEISERFPAASMASDGDEE